MSDDPAPQPTPPREDRVNVTDVETGDIYSVSPDDADALIAARRARLSTVEEDDEVFGTQTYGDRALETGLKSAISTATFGLANDSELERLREYNEGAALAGDIVGSAGIGAAAGLPLAGLRGAGLAGRALAGVAEGAVGAGAETASRLTRQAALGDPDLTAQEVLGQLGISTLLGGALGGAVDLGLGAVGGLGRGLMRGGQRGAQASREAMERLVERATGRAAQPGVADALLDTIGRRGTAGIGADDADFLQRSLRLSDEGRALREAIDAGEGAVDEVLRPMRQQIDDLMQVTEATSAFAKGSLKRAQVQRLVDADSLIRAADDIPSMVGGLRALADDVAKEAALPGGRALVRSLSEIAEEAEAAITQAAQTGGREGATDAFIALDRMKRKFGQQTARVMRSRNAGLLGPQFEEAYEVLRRGLERDDVWGKAAGMQREINAAWSESIANGQKFRRNFLTDAGEQEGFRRLQTADPKKLKAWLQRTGTAVSDVDDEVFERFARTQAQLNDVMSKHLDLDPATAEGAARARQLAEELSEQYRGVQSKVGAQNQFREASSALAERDSLIGQVLDPRALATAGGFVGLSSDSGGTGAAVGGGIGAALLALRRPDKLVRILAAMERMRGTFRARVDTSATQLVESATRMTGRGRAPVLAGTIGALSAREVGERFDRSVETLEKVRDPMAFVDGVSERIGAVAQAAPESAAQMVATAARAAEYLQQILPPTAVAAPGTLGSPRTTPSQRVPDYQQRQFLMAAQVVEDPISVLDEAARGTLSRTHVEALQAVYPRLHQQFVQRVVEDVADREEPLPYGGRISISLLVDVPTDPTLTGDYIRRQQPSGQEPTAMPAGEPVVTPGNAQAPEFSAMASSRMQRLTTRRA